MKYLLEVIEGNEKSFSNMYSPILNIDKRVTTKYDSKNVSKELFMGILATIQENLIKIVSYTIQIAVAQLKSSFSLPIVSHFSSIILLNRRIIDSSSSISKNYHK